MGLEDRARVNVNQGSFLERIGESGGRGARKGKDAGNDVRRRPRRSTWAG